MVIAEISGVFGWEQVCFWDNSENTVSIEYEVRDHVEYSISTSTIRDMTENVRQQMINNGNLNINAKSAFTIGVISVNADVNSTNGFSNTLEEMKNLKLTENKTSIIKRSLDVIHKITIGPKSRLGIWEKVFQTSDGLVIHSGKCVIGPKSPDPIVGAGKMRIRLFQVDLTPISLRSNEFITIENRNKKYENDVRKNPNFTTLGGGWAFQIYHVVIHIKEGYKFVGQPTLIAEPDTEGLLEWNKNYGIQNICCWTNPDRPTEDAKITVKYQSGPSCLQAVLTAVPDV